METRKKRREERMMLGLASGFPLGFSFPSSVTGKVSIGDHVRSFPVNLQVVAMAAGADGGGGGGRKVWRRRKLTKKDDMLRYRLQRVPFLEERMWKLKDSKEYISGDIERLFLSAENRFDLVNEVAAEATKMVDNNRDEYGFNKKAVLHALSDRMNDAGFKRPEAYYEPDPFKPGPGYVRDSML